MDLSVIIVTYNSEETIGACLHSVLSAAADLQLEVCVIDNNSTDDTVVVIREQFPSVAIVSNAINLGFAAGCNIGVRATTGKYVLLLNPDTVVEVGTISGMVSFLQNNSRAGIVGCQNLDGEGRPILSCRPRMTVFTIACSVMQLRKVFPFCMPAKYRLSTFATDQPPMQVGWVAGSALMLKREMIRRVGLMDEEFFLFCEEADLSLRAYEAGWQTWFLPRLKVSHLGSRSTKSMPFVTLCSYYLSYMYFVAKHFGRWHSGVLRVVLLTDLVARLTVRTTQIGNVWARLRCEHYRAIVRMVRRYKPNQHARHLLSEALKGNSAWIDATRWVPK